MFVIQPIRDRIYITLVNYLSKTLILKLIRAIFNSIAIIMSNRYHDHRRGYSRSRSKTYSRDRARNRPDYRERDRDKDRQRDQRDRDRQRERQREKDRQRQRDRDRQRERLREKERQRQRQRQRERQRQKQRERDRDKERERQKRQRQRDPSKRRYEDTDRLKNVRDNRISIDWKPKKDSKYKHYSSKRQSRSASSSSSSSSSYSSSSSKSKNSHRKHAHRDSRRKSKGREAEKYKVSSRQKSLHKKSNFEDKREFRDERDNHRRYEKDYHKSHYQHKPYNYRPPINFEKTYEVPNSQIKKHPAQEQIKKELSIEEPKSINTQKMIPELKQQIKKQQGEGKIVKSQMVDQSEPQVQIQIVKKEKTVPIVKPAAVLPQPIKRAQTQSIQPIVEKEKVPKVIQLINESRKNLQIPPLTPNFLMLDSFRTMKKFNAETLDPALLACLQRDFESNLEKERVNLFSNQIVIGEEKQSSRIPIPLAATEEQLSLRAEFETMRASLMTLNFLFRQLHVLQ